MSSTENAPQISTPSSFKVFTVRIPQHPHDRAWCSRFAKMLRPSKHPRDARRVLDLLVRRAWGYARARDVRRARSQR